MLSSMLKEHQARQAVRKEEQGKTIYTNQTGIKRFKNKYPITEVKRKEAIAASNELTQALVDHLNVGQV